MWRPRDRERYIGGYDPEREMPDPDRDRGGRFQSDAYRHNSRDTRFAYRWDPDRVEGRWADRGPRDYDRDRWERDARDFDRDRGFRGPYGESGYDRGYDRDFSPQYGRGEYDRGYEQFTGRDEFGRDRYGRDRYAGDRWSGGYRDEYDRDRDRDRDRGYGRPWEDYDRDRWRR